MKTIKIQFRNLKPKIEFGSKVENSSLLGSHLKTILIFTELSEANLQDLGRVPKRLSENVGFILVLINFN